MTPAGQRWTCSKPTAPGWYWWRFDSICSHDLVRIMICNDGSLAEVSNNGHALLAAGFDGEWQGPLTPNEATE